jgi:adenine-specific DNA-methyltransferase
MTDDPIQPVSRAVPDLAAEQVAQLKRLFPECVAEGRVDFDRLRATLGDLDALAPRDGYSFTWAGKQEAFRALQAPTHMTLRPAPEESINWDDTRHLFIEGENLEVLKLLYKAYYNRVKMIYIDPPYNTGNDFIYQDDFAQPRRAYLEKTGQMDAEGNRLVSNPESSGRYHSDWLSMIYPRLFLARQLLRDDGVIFVSIDDHEVHHLRLVMNEVFGEENFVATIVWEKVHTRKNSALYFSVSHDYILVYARTRQQKGGQPGWARNLLPRENTDAYQNPDDDPRGPWKPDPVYANNPYSADYRIHKPNGVQLGPPQGQYWRFSEDSWQRFVREGSVIWGNGDSYPMVKRYLSDVQDGLVPVTLFTREFAGDNATANAELDSLMGIDRLMDYPKPSLLIQRLMQIGTVPHSSDIVLDFFAGSCTTAQAVLELNGEDGGNRQFIMVQMPEPTDREDFPTIAAIGAERIRRVIARMNAEREGQLPLDGAADEDLGFKLFKLGPSTQKQWAPPAEDDVDALARQLAAFDDGLLPDASETDILYEVLIKEGYSPHASIQPLDTAGQRVYRIQEPDDADGRAFYACLEPRLAEATVDALPLERETLFVCRDTALDDSLKTNLSLRCVLRAL